MPDPVILGTQALTLRDTAEAARDKSGNLKANILDFVSETNGAMDDMTFLRADNGDKLSTDFLNELPHGHFVALGEGVPADKAGFSVAWDTCAKIRGRIQISRDLYEHTKQKDALWAQHVKALSTGMKEDVADAVFYGNIRNEPKKFNGLATFYDKFGTANITRRHYAHNVISAGTGTAGAPTSSAMLRSVWLVSWGDQAITGFYPEMSPYAGLSVGKMEDMVLNDRNGNPVWHKTQEIDWEVGLAIRNFMAAGRVCNIELDSASSSGFGVALLTHMRHLRARVKQLGSRRAFYVSEQLFEIIEDALWAQTQGNAIKYADAQQERPTSLWGIPIRLCDCLDVNEAAVTAIA